MIIIEQGKVELFGELAEYMSDTTILLYELTQKTHKSVEELSKMFIAQVNIIDKKVKDEDKILNPLSEKQNLINEKISKLKSQLEQLKLDQMEIQEMK